MGKCLVTKLNGSVNNDSLSKIGELRIHITSVDSPEEGTQSLKLGINAPVSLEIIGDGYFTDSTLSSNQGKTKSLDASGMIYFSNGNFDISISKKYVLTSINFGNTNTNKGIDLADLYMCKYLSELYIWGSSTVGIYSDLETLERLSILNLSGIPKVDGNLSSFKNLSYITNITVGSAKGSLSDLYNLSNLKTLQVGKCEVTGDLSKMPANFIYAQFGYNKSMLNWTERSSTSKIIGIGGYPLIDNIDKMLQDQANGVVGFTGKPSWYKNISVKGNRTSASDAAVATLQQKGYTVSITPA